MKKLKWSRDKLRAYILGASPKEYDSNLVSRVLDSMEEPLAFREAKKKKKEVKA